MQSKYNLTGERIGKLTVIALAPPNRLKCRHQRFWVCQCECGRKEEILQMKLVGSSPPMACSYCRATISHHLDAVNLGAEYTEEEVEFIKAVDEYKERTRRPATMALCSLVRWSLRFMIVSIFLSTSNSNFQYLTQQNHHQTPPPAGGGAFFFLQPPKL